MEKVDLLNILRTGETVFTFKEILLNSRGTDPALLKRRICYYVKTGELYPVRRGIYARDKNYDRLELAAKIISPSYISFETVLTAAGIAFQHYESIFIASNRSKTFICDGQTYSYRKIRDDILTAQIGIENQGRYFIASKERAILDTLYLNKDYHFDNLSGINWNQLLAISPIYKSERIEKTINKLMKTLKDEN
jgi:hypothetical protein